MSEVNGHSGELIAVRSLRFSDLGWFAAHRENGGGRQRAININSNIARGILSAELFAAGGGTFPCVCEWQGHRNEEDRRLYKEHKNWRLAGRKLEGDIFGQLDACDFILIRTRAGNNGTSPLHITFVSKELEREAHAELAASVRDYLTGSMAVFSPEAELFANLQGYFPQSPLTQPPVSEPATAPPEGQTSRRFRPIPRTTSTHRRTPTLHDRLRSPGFMEQMLRVAGDLSANSQFLFMDTLERLAGQLRLCLMETGRIVRFDRNHPAVWERVNGQSIAFVDGGMASLSMLGSAPIAARVGTYIVTPGQRDQSRESFTFDKQLIDELYESSGRGVYGGAFPNVSDLRDAARISVEAAGAIQALRRRTDLQWLFLHGSLVSPASTYTDIMEEGTVLHRFPDFSPTGLEVLLGPEERNRQGRDANFINVYLRQLVLLQNTEAVVCGVVERESSATTVYKAVIDSLNESEIARLLPIGFEEWKYEFLGCAEDFRFTDALLFRCVLEPGEALLPIAIDRNEPRRAPPAWREVISRYPMPHVSYMLATDWTAPFRIELFEKDVTRFRETAELLYHCSLLLPRYAFPVGLDIADKFAKVPAWMSRPVNNHTVVQALRRAMDSGDTHVFDALRRMLCGSSRDWLLRPGING